MMALGVICDFASLRTPYLYRVTDARLVVMGKPVSSCRLLRRHVFRVRDMIGHRSAGTADEVASCLARELCWGSSRERTC